jgi:hypothetical protein
MSIEIASAYGLAMTIFNRFLDCARNDTSASSVQTLLTTGRLSFISALMITGRSDQLEFLLQFRGQSAILFA